jgi:excisionase family DNA binding protein
MSSNIRINRICEFCGNEFTARTTVTKYCSDTCSKRAYKARKRTEKVEASNQETKQAKEKPLAEIKARDYWSISEVCTLTGVSRWTIWRQINNGNLPAAKLGKRILIRKADLEALFYPQVTPMYQPPEPEFNRADWYFMGEIQEKFGISEKALFDMVKRKGWPVVREGKYRLVPKAEVHRAFM